MLAERYAVKTGSSQCYKLFITPNCVICRESVLLGSSVCNLTCSNSIPKGSTTTSTHHYLHVSRLPAPLQLPDLAGGPQLPPGIGRRRSAG